MTICEAKFQDAKQQMQQKMQQILLQLLLLLLAVLRLLLVDSCDISRCDMTVAVSWLRCFTSRRGSDPVPVELIQVLGAYDRSWPWGVDASRSTRPRIDELSICSTH